ncbi:MAG: MYG1 family protein [Magnetospirillum sp.]|nr:MYG1 family protein [Magnetospirillum sp.]
MTTVATHSGTFHADDCFAFAILRAALGGAVTLVRSREQAVLEAAAVVFDVGGTCDPAAGRYDHHMRDRPLRPSGEPFSSAGLVWRDYGPRAVRALLPAVTETEAAQVVERVDGGLIRDIDLMDNGAMTPTPGHFSTVLEAFNPTFAEEEGDEDAAFAEAAELAGRVLARAVARAHAAVLAAETVAEAARTAEDPRILVLERRVPWEDAVFDLSLGQALYVVRPAGKQWTVSAVPPERTSFAQRKPLPEAWGGLRDGDFAAATGVADATFCHPARFVCGAISREGAVTLAKLAAG